MQTEKAHTQTFHRDRDPKRETEKIINKSHVNIYILVF